MCFSKLPFVHIFKFGIMSCFFVSNLKEFDYNMFRGSSSFALPICSCKKLHKITFFFPDGANMAFRVGNRLVLGQIIT